MSTPTHYEILSLPPSLLPTTPSSSSSSNNQLLKRAYRRALLNHHPDKSNTTTKPHTTTTNTTTNTATTTTPRPKPTYTIDQITLAYTTLSTPSVRAAYDRELALLPHPTTNPNSPASQRENQKTGLETVDLDDLSHSSTGGDGDGNGGGEEWFRACRCGNARGFRVREEDLSEALEDMQMSEGAGAGEVVVGCVDCSLWLRVLFAVVDGDEGDELKGVWPGSEYGDGEEDKGEGL